VHRVDEDISDVQGLEGEDGARAKTGALQKHRHARRATGELAPRGNLIVRWSSRVEGNHHLHSSSWPHLPGARLQTECLMCEELLIQLNSQLLTALRSSQLHGGGTEHASLVVAVIVQLIMLITYSSRLRSHGQHSETVKCERAG
jgi:hypothetical protein